MTNTDRILDFYVSFDNKYVLEGKRDEGVFLYACVKARKARKTTKRTPLNISLVIDRSGSMAEKNKLDYVKEACKLVVDNLSADDFVSIVAYSTDVEIVCKSAPLKDKQHLKKLIDSIHPTNSTNLSGGMLEGFAQVKSTYNEKYINRVLLLSDGLANTGVCYIDDLQQIVKEQYLNNKIAISTFGVGADFNEDLMTDIAEFGKGNYYFIDSSDKIPQIFKQELQGLLSVVAQNVRINVKKADGFKLEKVYACNYKMDGEEISVDFNDVFAEEEKGVLVKFSLTKKFYEEAEFLVCLLYDDVVNNYNRVHECTAVHIIPVSDEKLYQSGENADAVKNKVLLLANDRFEQAVKAVDNHDYDTARTILRKNKEFMADYGEVLHDSPELEAQMASNESYESVLDDIANQSAEEFSMTQKMTKSNSYLLRKKRSKFGV